MCQIHFNTPAELHWAYCFIVSYCGLAPSEWCNVQLAAADYHSALYFARRVGENGVCLLLGEGVQGNGSGALSGYVACTAIMTQHQSWAESNPEAVLPDNPATVPSTCMYMSLNQTQQEEEEQEHYSTCKVLLSACEQILRKYRDYIKHKSRVLTCMGRRG